MRLIWIFPLLAGLAGAQTMTEMGGAVAGGAIGTAAGKKTSEAITAIFGKVDTTTKKASKADDPSKKEPLLEVGEGTETAKLPAASSGSSYSESVPPPPPVGGFHRAAPKPAPEPVMPPILPPPPPPPPQVTTDDLRRVSSGMSRQDLLRLGEPAARITMDDNGHLVETYSYYHKDNSIGRVKLTDGAVSSVEVKP